MIYRIHTECALCLLCSPTAEHRWVGVEMDFWSKQILLLPPTLLFLLPWGKTLIIIDPRVTGYSARIYCSLTSTILLSSTI